MSEEEELIWTVFNGHFVAFELHYNNLAICKECGASHTRVAQICEKCGVDMNAEKEIIRCLDELDTGAQECINTLMKTNKKMAIKMENLKFKFYTKFMQNRY